MIRNYFITALRNLWRNKVFSVINIAGLSVGLASCMLIYLNTIDELSYDKFNSNAPNIYHLVVDEKDPAGGSHRLTSTGDMPGPDFKRQLPDVLDFVRIQSAGCTVKRGSEVFDQDVFYVDSSFFSVFTFPMLYGKPEHVLDDPHSVVLSEEIAEKYFGKVNPVGKTLDLKTGNSFQPFVVTAVTKKSPQNSSIQIRMLLPKKANYFDNQWLNFFQNTFLVIKPGTDINRLEGRMNKIFLADAATQIKEAASKYGDRNKRSFHLNPLLAIHTSDDYPVSNGLVPSISPRVAYILSGIALFILIIACINFVNLTVARSLKRAKEIGIRKVFGGRRKQLIIQFLGESFILSFLAFILAIGLVQLILPSFSAEIRKSLSFSALISFKLVAGYVGIFLLTGFLAGFYPALVLSALNPVDSLYQRTQYAGKNYLAKGLVVLQFTIAIFFIISVAIVYSQFNYMLHYDLGYNDKDVVSIRASGIDNAKMSLFKTELSREPSVLGITADQGERWTMTARINGSEQFGFDMMHIDEDYLPLLQVPIVKGRNFSKSMALDSATSVLVNEEFVKQARWKDPLDQAVDFFYDHKTYHVIGVVKDFHTISLVWKTPPTLYTMKPNYIWGDLLVKIKERNEAKALDDVQKKFKAIFPLIPYQYKFKAVENEALSENAGRPRHLMGFSAALTIFISCIGLFGLATLSTERRKKEIGIRKVLGASVQGIVRKLSTEFAVLILISFVIAAPLAWLGMHRWLQSFAYRIGIGAGIFLLTGMLVLLVALVTISFQTIRAATANPVNSLRSE